MQASGDSNPDSPTPLGFRHPSQAKNQHPLAGYSRNIHLDRLPSARIPLQAEGRTGGSNQDRATRPTARCNRTMWTQKPANRKQSACRAAAAEAGPPSLVLSSRPCILYRHRHTLQAAPPPLWDSGPYASWSLQMPPRPRAVLSSHAGDRDGRGMRRGDGGKLAWYCARHGPNTDGSRRVSGMDV